MGTWGSSGHIHSLQRDGCFVWELYTLRSNTALGYIRPRVDTISPCSLAAPLAREAEFNHMPRRVAASCVRREPRQAAFIPSHFRGVTLHMATTSICMYVCMYVCFIRWKSHDTQLAILTCTFQGHWPISSIVQLHTLVSRRLFPCRRIPFTH